jgi:branched-subunit amino acid ABC-type transport system permease component
MARIRRQGKHGIAVAFGMSGLLAGIGAYLLVAQTGEVAPDLGSNPGPIVCLVTALEDGAPARWCSAATGSARSSSGSGVLSLELRSCRDAFAFAVVIVMLPSACG